MSKGMKYDEGKPDWTLVPFNAMDQVVSGLTYGATKYDRHNWRKIEPLRYHAAAMRHISSFMQGQVIDRESGLHHLAHAICSLLIALEHDTNQRNIGIANKEDENGESKETKLS